MALLRRAALVACWVVLGCGRGSLDGEFLDGVGGSPADGGTNTGGTGGLGIGGSPGGSGGIGGAGGIGGTGGVGGSGGSGGTGGAGGSCGGNQDCVSADPCEVARCAFGICLFSIRDRDGDGFTDALCGGPDCNDLNVVVYPGSAEVCTDGSDNDCNGVADCFDPACGANCGCVPSPGGEDCDNGLDDDCDGTSDCNDTECIGTPVCGCRPEICDNGADDDCDGFVDCADSNCATTQACVCQGTFEDCANRVDDDCDGLVDCADPNCATSGNCGCTSPTAENCANGRDDDCDGLIDCGDPNCFANAACQTCRPEVCSGGLDEDCDGAIDCADPSCALSPECPATIEVCNNSRDDDFDGRIDCLDDDCANTPLCRAIQGTCATARRIDGLGSYQFTGETYGQVSNYSGTCGGAAGEDLFWFVLNAPARAHFDTVGSNFDTVLYLRKGSCELGEELDCDDDGGGWATSSALDFDLLPAGTYFVVVDGLTIDPIFGANEGEYVLSVELDVPSENCTDGRDNDGDVYADCADPDCAGAPSCVGCAGGAAPTAEFGIARCTDGIDNDCDGNADCDDDDCTASESVPVECCNGIEESGNNILDDFACRCRSDADCPVGQLCYTSTTGTCGLPCNFFFGNICPFLAPGSSCNVTTRQCEF